jgi:LL-diaminopimelate aminotransferase
VVSLIGSKEGIANISFCYLDPGDISLVPDPGYPVYSIGALLAGGEAYYVNAGAATNYLVDLDSIPEDIASKAKLLWINYPNNPTGATADRAFYEKVVAFAKKYDIIVCHDAAYSEMSYDGYVPLSFMEIPGAKDVGIEFNSLSKPFNMTGWRIGWAVGNAKVIETLGRYKSNVDSGAFQAIQYAAITGLSSSQNCVKDMAKLYQERRDVLVDGLREIGWEVATPKATFYVWVPVPKGYGTSAEFAEFLLDKAQVVVTPGNGYGKNGEGFIRMAITVEKERIAEAVERMKKVLGKIEF